MKVKKYRQKLFLKRLLIHLLQITLVCAFVLLWELLANQEIINEFLFSKPSAIMKLLINYFKSGEIYHHLRISLYETMLGLVIGTSLGMIVAIILWFNRFLARVIDPFLVVLNALPKTALAPIFIIWAGTGVKGIVVVAVSISLVVTIISMYSYFNGVDKEKVKMLKSFGANKFQILTKLVLPSNFSNIIDVIKINIGMSWIGVIVGEFIVSREGIGYLLTYGSQVFKLDLVMMSVVILGVIAYLMYIVASLVEKLVVKKYEKKE